MLLLSAILLPLAASLLTGFTRGAPRVAINLAAGMLLLACASTLLLEVATSGRQSIAIGAWAIPYGIELAADGLSAAMALLVAVVGLGVLVFAARWPEMPEQRGLYPLLHCLVAATMATILAADLFNLYVWLELMLMATLGLLVLGGKPRNHEAAFKYFALNMLGALLILAAVGLIYGASGQLNLDALARVAAEPEQARALPVYVGLLLVALLLKAGAFPLFAWLPAAYHTLPAPVLALVGGLLTKVAIYVLLRLTGQVFDIAHLHQTLGWLAVATMLSGVLGAAYHWDLRRILAFHIVSQIGYLLLGLALASQAAATASGFFLFHNVLVKTNLFLISGLMWCAMGHYDLRRGGGLFAAQPMLAALFLLSALSLVGVPPTTGFWGKFMILKEALDQERFVWAAIALATGFLTLYSMSKIWLEAFWKPHPEQAASNNLPMPGFVAVASLSALILLVGLYPDPVIDYLRDQSTALWRFRQ